MIHSRDFSASASARWLGCPASVIQVRNYTGKGSNAAQEGSACHQLGEIAIKGALSSEQVSEYTGKSLSDAPNIIIDKEMVYHAFEYAQYCLSFEGDHFVEVKVSYENIVKGGFGTSDFISIDRENKKIYAVDLKYGRKVVNAENNTQAQLYALGILNDFDFIYDFDNEWEVEIHIYQPRISNFSVWKIGFDELVAFGNYATERAALSLQDNPPYKPSDSTCMWCAHKGNCTALAKYTSDIISADFDNLELPTPESVDHSKVLQAKKLIESWLKAVEEIAFEKLNNGEKVEGFKIVSGRGSRKWVDEKAAYNLLITNYTKDELETRKFLTVPQAEKLIGKGKGKFNDYADLITKTQGSPTLVTLDDKRPDLNSISDCFEEIL